MAILEESVIEQLKTIFADIKANIVFNVFTDNSENETVTFLEEVCSTSPKLTVKISPSTVDVPYFEIVKEGVGTGIKFCGIPNGHEFTTLLLAVLNADGQGKNLPDDAIATRIKALKGPAKLQTIVSLTCTNCPDVAQALNIVALLNDSVENTVIDGAVNPNLVNEYNIQSVPAVYADGQPLSVGRSSLGDLLDKLETKYGTTGEVMEQEHEYDVLVLGGGPAGTSAAVYCARKGFRTAVVAGAVGGQVRETMGIENLISVPKTTGPELAGNLKAHLSAYPIEIFENRTVDTADIAGEVKILTCGKETFRGKYLIIATGASWRRLSVPGETEHLGHGVAFCTHCDGPFYAGRQVAVVGGGNSGIEAAIDLASICPHVYVFEYADMLKADDMLRVKALSMGNVEIHVMSQVIEVIGDSKEVSGIRVKDRITDTETVYPVSGIFVQIGLLPNSGLFKESLRLNARGEIMTDETCRTSVKGVYAAGDVSDVPYKQIVVAMGEGAKAALSVFEDSLRGQ